MFNETSYKTAWQGRRDSRPQAITSTGGDDRFYAPGYGPSVVESPGFLAPPGPAQGATQPPVAAAPAVGGGIMETISALPTWMLLAGAAGAYFLFFKKGR